MIWKWEKFENTHTEKLTEKQIFVHTHDGLAEGLESLRSYATCWRTMRHWHEVSQTCPVLPHCLILWRHTPPPSKCSNSFQLSYCCCHCHWLSKRHEVIKEQRRNCLGSAVAVIALSEPSGRVCIEGGKWGEQGGGWRCPPDKSSRVGSRCLVQPGSNRVPQFRVAWQAPCQTGTSAPDRGPRCSPNWSSTAAPVKVLLFIPDPTLPSTHNIIYHCAKLFVLFFCQLFLHVS